MEEPTLRSQTNMALGEAMRSYRGFGLPGIDHAVRLSRELQHGQAVRRARLASVWA